MLAGLLDLCYRDSGYLPSKNGIAVRHEQCYTACAIGGASLTRSPDTQLFRDAFNANHIGIVVENLEGTLYL